MAKRKYTSKRGNVYDIHYGAYTGASVNKNGVDTGEGFETPADAIRHIEEQEMIESINQPGGNQMG